MLYFDSFYYRILVIPICPQLWWITISIVDNLFMFAPPPWSLFLRIAIVMLTMASLAQP